MSRRYLCLGLWSAGTLCYVLAASIIYQFWLSPDDGSKSIFLPTPSANSQLPDTLTYEQHNLVGSETIWTMKLQLPLFEAPLTQDRTKRINKPRTLGILLLGTAVDSSQKSAIFSLPNGIIQVRKVGESVGKSPNTAIVREIKEGAVVVEYAKELVTLRVQTKD